MLKKIQTISLLFVLLSNFVYGGEPDVKLHKKCIYPTVWIRNVTANTNGSGVIVSSNKENGQWKNTVWTVAHMLGSIAVTEPTTKTTIIIPPQCTVSIARYTNWSTFEGYSSRRLSIVKADPVKDFAICEFTSDEEMPYAEVESNPKLYIGNEVFRIGHGFNLDARLDYGRITSLNPSFVKGQIRTSIYSVSGDSGGPVFENYKLVGILTSVQKDQTQLGHLVYGVSYFTPSNEIK